MSSEREDINAKLKEKTPLENMSDNAKMYGNQLIDQNINQMYSYGIQIGII